jgi:MFS family permease
MTTPARPDPYASLRNTDFRWFVTSLVVFTLGVQIQATVVAWQVYEITRDPLSLGLVGLAEALPYISAALYAGHLADRHDRKRISLMALSVQTACTGILVAFTFNSGIFEGGRVWPIYCVVFASGLARSFLQPARTALAAEIVPRELYANAIAWRSSLWQGAAVAGPALGGVLYGFSGPRAAFLAAAVLCFASLVLFAAVAYTPKASGEADEGTIGENLTLGVRFLLRQPELLGAQVLDLFAVLFGGAPALLPIFASEILHTGPQGLGVLRAAPAAGAVLMSALLAHRRLKRAGPTLFTCVAVFGLCWILFGLSTSFWWSLTLLAISGAVDAVSVIVRSTLLNLRTPSHLLGRVSAVNQIFIGSSNEIGSFESGVAARLLGAVGAVVAGGLITLGVVGVTAWKTPALRKLDELG